MSKRIIIAGGGTGGHIFPALAIAHAMKAQAPATEILFVGAKGRMEMEKVPQAGFPIKGLDIAGFNRSSLWKNIGLPWKLIKSFFQVRKIVGDFMPDAVVGVGGYSSFPVLRYAQMKGIPTFIHESNSFAGKSNQMLGKGATRVFVVSEGMDRFFPASKMEVTGNPVRKSIAQKDAVSKEAALEGFGLVRGKTTILAMGGSLGARSINEALAGGLPALLDAGLQVIWQTGKTGEGKWKEAGAGKNGLWVGPFITDMEKAYAAADIVVSRSGAMAVAELCVVQKPSVFVPYPHAAEDHQRANAERLVKENAAMMIADNEVNTKLVPALLELAKDRNRQQLLENNIGKFAVRDADEVIARTILNSLS